jgi:hypothetical protein
MLSVMNRRNPEVTLSPASARGRYGMAVRNHGIDSIQAAEARVDLAEANIAQAIRDQLDASPPLSREAKKRIIALLDS